MGLYLRGDWYWLRRMIDGRLYRRPIKLRRGQESLLSARLAQIEDEVVAVHFGLPLPHPGASVMFSDYVKKYLERKAHKASLDRDEQRLEAIQAANKIWPDLPLTAYKMSHVEALEKHLVSDGLRPATVNRYVELLRHLFNMAIEDKLVSENPTRAWEPYVEDGTRRALTREEIKLVLDAARGIEKKKRFGPIRHLAHDLMLFALATGMRLSEILNLKRSQIQDDFVALPLSSTKSRRRGIAKQRFKVVALNSLARGIINRQPAAGEYVFPLRRRHPNIVFYIVESIREKTGINDFTFHHLRHTASTVVSSSSSLSTARAVLGHADIKTTLRYTHPDLEDQRQSVTKLSTYLEGIVGQDAVK